MQSEILTRAQNWIANSSIDQIDRDVVAKLVKENNIAELTEIFYRDLEFGTGGLRSILGVGSNRMNKYNVRRATQAMSNIILKNHDRKSQPSACVSYDSRNFSKEFSREVASVFAANGIKAYIYNDMTPVPMLSFAVRHKKSQAGVMITASHNPPKYNGFKAFWADGCQVIPPVDKEIIEAYNSLSDSSKIKIVDFEVAKSNGMIEFLSNDVREKYFEILASRIQDPQMCKDHGAKLKVVYTSIHGTGFTTCPEFAKRIGFANFHLLEEQAKPDGNFPTVKSPNPEDPNALELAIQKMQAINADLVMGTDPDTDRLGVAYIENGKKVFLNGNQIAVLMLHYVLEKMQAKKQIGPDALVVKSIVTSPMQDVICDSFKTKIISTLTGFKWMGGALTKLENQKIPFQFIFASEESFGYMGHAEVRDKDGVCAVLQMLEVALHYKLKGMNLTQALDKLYEQYGFFHESLLSLDYEGKTGAEKIARLMDFFRTSRPVEITGEAISEVEDYKTLTHTLIATKKTTSIDQTKSDVLGFTFTSGNKLYLRPSGTEPKIKFYTMVRSTKGTLEEKKKNAMDKINDIENYIKTVAKDI